MVCADDEFDDETLQQWMSRNEVAYEVETRWVVEKAHACRERCRRLRG